MGGNAELRSAAAEVPLTTCFDLCHDPPAPSINIRQLRDPPRRKAWLRAGKTVELRDRQRVIARTVPEKSPAKPTQRPDFAAMRREIFGDRVPSAVDDLIADRRRARY